MCWPGLQRRPLLAPGADVGGWSSEVEAGGCSNGDRSPAPAPGVSSMIVSTSLERVACCPRYVIPHSIHGLLGTVWLGWAEPCLGACQKQSCGWQWVTEPLSLPGTRAPMGGCNASRAETVQLPGRGCLRCAKGSLFPECSPLLIPTPSIWSSERNGTPMEPTSRAGCP